MILEHRQQIGMDTTTGIAEASAASADATRSELAQLAEQRRALEQEQALWTEMAQKLDLSQIKDPITLNVGGTRFQTTLATLTAIPDSFFGSMFSGRWGAPQDEDGSYFVDAEPATFRWLLDCMRRVSRGQDVVAPNKLSMDEKACLLGDAKYFNIQPLIELMEPGAVMELTSQPFHKSHLLVSPQHIAALLGFLKADGIAIANRVYPLLYRATRDGWSASEFHSRCDDKGATVTVIRSSNGSIFGGYAESSWSCSGSQYKCGHAFLFSLMRTHAPDGHPVKLALRPTQASKSIYSGLCHGPVFGFGHDLCLSGTAESSYNIGRQCSSNLGHSYQVLPGMMVGSSDAQSFMAGSHMFTCSEVEVFQTT